VSYEVLEGDCIERMADMEEASVDAVVCDPPYGLSREPDIAEVLKHWLAGDDYEHRGGGFMGQSWDSFVPGPAVWREAYRVLKPGGHLLAFAGTRTADLMGISIRMAGFERRDSIASLASSDGDLLWMFGSGFPKSLDVSKAIDKANGKHDRDLAPFGSYVRQARKAKGWSLRELDQAMGTNTAASWWEGRKAGVQPPGVEMYERLKALLGLDDRFDDLVAWAEAQREKIGEQTKARSTDSASALPTMGAGVEYRTWDLTAPATPEAAQWEGWGTALKPSHEPIVVARKPLIGTVAANVLEHGTGGFNIDACRIEGPAGDGNWSGVSEEAAHNAYNDPLPEQRGEQNVAGRWPANIVLSEEAAAELDEQTGVLGSAARSGGSGMGYHGANEERDFSGYNDPGGASRFFYQAKTSRAERNAGLEGFEEKEGLEAKLASLSDPRMDRPQERRPQANNHPTVKPINLMRWLCRLVTPSGGLILDPFLGSGTTGAAAVLEGFDFIGIERESAYVAIAEARIAFWAQHQGCEAKDVFADEAKRKRKVARQAEIGQAELGVVAA
jgi:DNA modification methylase/transcriptional regulator with XRE-family HTH domain